MQILPEDVFEAVTPQPEGATMGRSCSGALVHLSQYKQARVKPEILVSDPPQVVERPLLCRVGSALPVTPACRGDLGGKSA